MTYSTKPRLLSNPWLEKIEKSAEIPKTATLTPLSGGHSQARTQYSTQVQTQYSAPAQVHAQIQYSIPPLAAQGTHTSNLYLTALTNLVKYRAIYIDRQYCDPNPLIFWRQTGSECGICTLLNAFQINNLNSLAHCLQANVPTNAHGHILNTLQNISDNGMDDYSMYTLREAIQQANGAQQPSHVYTLREEGGDWQHFSAVICKNNQWYWLESEFEHPVQISVQNNLTIDMMKRIIFSQRRSLSRQVELTCVKKPQ